jgi:hypothetical protein
MSKVKIVESKAADDVQVQPVHEGYETPTLVKVDTAQSLLLGPTYTANYYDHGFGTTNYPS